MPETEAQAMSDEQAALTAFAQAQAAADDAMAKLVQAQTALQQAQNDWNDTRGTFAPASSYWIPYRAVALIAQMQATKDAAQAAVNAQFQVASNTQAAKQAAWQALQNAGVVLMQTAGAESTGPAPLPGPLPTT
jgi:hypothetical protein